MNIKYIDEPLVSVVMPAYNVENYIGNSIKSVLAQSYQNWELIIIDDGSTDGTLNQANSFLHLDSRIKIYSQKNQGVSVARNAGINKANGSFISFLDADDIYDSFFLEKMSKCLMKNKADAVVCKHKKKKGTEVIEETDQNVTVFPENSFALYLLQNKFAVMASMYRLDFIRNKKIVFTPDCIIGEDSEFLLKVVASGKISFVPDYLYFYVYRSNSSSHSEHTYKHLHDHLQSYDRVCKYLEESGLEDTQLYIEYIKRQKNFVLKNFRRKLWQDLKNGNFYIVEDQLEKYGKKLVHDSSNFVQKIGADIKLSILNSRSTPLWKLIHKLFK